MAVGMGITLIGLGRIFSNFDKALENARTGTARGLNQTGNIILGRALPITPIDTGALRQSGRVKDAEKKTLEAFVSYGRDDVVNPKTGKPTSEYAVAVHEIPAFHDTGQRKFLAEAANEISNREMPRTIAAAIEKHLGDGLR